MARYPYRLLLLLLFWMAFAAVSDAVRLTLLYTGETHAALVPCDCPIEPYGGIARRATVIQREKEAEPDLLLLDVGGAFAGGMFDEYSLGPEQDRIRTEHYLDAMQKMGYHAIAAGDEEFRFGPDFLLRQSMKVPILSANTFFQAGSEPGNRAGSRPLAPILRRTVRGVRVALLGLTTPDAARVAGRDLRFRDPIQIAKELLPALRAESDLIILLAHLGEEASRRLLREVDGIDILINGHHKQTHRAYEQVEGAYLLQFNYQGRKLGRLTFDYQNGQIVSPEFSQIPLDSTIPDDPSMADLVREVTQTPRSSSQLRLDLYVASGDPYTPAAVRAVADALRQWKDALDWNLYFIVSEQDGKLRAPGGEKALEESRIEAVIARYYPGKLWDYLVWRQESIRGTPWQEGAEKLGLHRTRLEMAVRSGQADQILREHAWRVARLHVVRSPTLYINHQVYTGLMRSDALVRALCAKLGTQMPGTPCADLPVCVADPDCAKEGFIGVCEEAGTPRARCRHEKAVKVPLTVIYAPEAYLSNEEDIIRSSRSMFPGVQVTLLSVEAPEGLGLLEQLGLQRLPAYLFGEAILRTRNLERIKPSLRKVQEYYVADPASVGAPVWVSRARQPYVLDVFIQPLSPNATRAWIALIRSLQQSQWAPRLRYLLEYRAAEEEAARQRVIQRHHPARFESYLNARIDTFESSYWEDALLAIGLDPQQIKRWAQEEGSQLLKEDRTLARTLGLTGEMALLVENREAVSLQSATQFRGLIERLTGVRLGEP